MFSVFKQYYTYFYTFFHPHVFKKKKTENCCLNTCTKWASKQPKIKGSYLYDSVKAIVQTFFFFCDYLVDLNLRLFFEKNLNLRPKARYSVRYQRTNSEFR